MEIGHLEISTYIVISVGATHWYCSIYIEDNNKLIEVKKLERELTSKEIIALNKIDRERGYPITHKMGNMTEGFISKEDAVSAGVKYFKEKYTGILFDSGYGSLSAWKKAIVYPHELTELVNKMNALADQFQSLNGYEGNNRTLVESIDNQWYKLYIKLIGTTK